ncbi:succinate dehydrogenase / fumarate reductase cytochrome b subunit [Winogradskyella eximia]|jgi:succinate dehydrogenase cytochrome b subunit|uniref:Succinate dehydrogenase / fumarate reductase cytochrome b subunit n=1 Tax=Winogradskyella eximia TaxID=262006 RepID=A0A3D9H521_9FLAO|nr:succinate dehydrogenase cytochrome b subunit [Winogradskyella eximia]RED44594.1 succinate dehydrogenase / fumarate reductase cytochrome b subunit [Winogradskyella eximia]
MSGILNSSIGRKFAMALSALFLMIFVLQHFVINLFSVLSPDTFNEISHFMGTFWVVQYVIQPILIIGVIFHFVMGFVLEIKNKKANGVKYAKNNGAANSTWMSRNMIWSGGFILAFLIIHFIDFWIPEINTKYIIGDMSGMHNGEFRYFHELQEKFVPIWRVALYIVGFVFLALHLLHGFDSAFQSTGANNKYTKGLQGFGKAYAILVPLGFIFIALFHHFTH